MEHNIARIILTISFLSSIQELSKATGSNYSKFRGHNNLCLFWTSLRRLMGDNFDAGLSTKCATSKP